VHISELAHHHVENPREVVEPGQEIKVKVLEIDSDRRRLSLSVKRVSDNAAGPTGDEDRAGDLEDVPDLALSEDVFAGPEVTVEGSDDLRTAVREAAEDEAGEAAPEQRPDETSS
jgi:small subunit ribosomal protein S1